ncbi:MAG: TolC family protein, partial [Bdellovibrionia bacterium]
MKILALFLCLGISMRAQGQEGAVRNFTVKTAVETALTSSPAVRASYETSKEARAKKSAAFSGIFPTVTANFSGMQRKDAFNSQSMLFGGETYNYYDVGIDAEQPIFTGGAMFGGLKYYGAAADLSEKEYQLKRREMTKTTILAFYQLLISQKQVESFERSFKLQEQLVQ